MARLKRRAGTLSRSGRVGMMRVKKLACAGDDAHVAVPQLSFRSEVQLAKPDVSVSMPNTASSVAEPCTADSWATTPRAEVAARLAR